MNEIAKPGWRLLGMLLLGQLASLAGAPVSAAAERTALVESGQMVANPGDQLVLKSASRGRAYQWEWNGIVLCGETDSSLTLRTVNTTNAGAYSVVTTSGRVKTTNTITVVTGPQILAQPQDCITPYHGTASFRTTVIGRAPFTYQWQFNGANIPGGTDATLVRSNATEADIGTYDVLLISRLEGDAYVAISSNALLDVTEPLITTPTHIVFAQPGQTVRLTNIVAGDSSLTYRWYKQAKKDAIGTWSYWNLAGGHHNAQYVLAAVSGQDKSILTLAEVSSADSGVYKLLVRSRGRHKEQRVSQEIDLCVDPAITDQPKNQIVDAGADVTFSVEAWSTNMSLLTYQWRSNKAIIPDATASSYSLTRIGTNFAGHYSVIVSNARSGIAVTSSMFDGVLSVRTPIWLTTNRNRANLVSDFNTATTDGTTTNWYCVSNADFFNVILTSSIPHIVHYDAGVFETRGAETNVNNTAQPGWQHWGNTDANGPTILRLVCNLANAHYNFVFRNFSPSRVDGFELHDLILDCNANAPTNRLLQSRENSTCWGGVATAGNNLLISNITLTNFGKQGRVEVFPLHIVPYQALDENSHVITLYSNITVANSLFANPGSNNGSTLGGLTVALIQPGWTSDGTIYHITNAGFKNCVVSNVISDFNYTHGFTGVSVQNCVVDGCEVALYWEDAGPVSYGQDALFQGNYFTNVNFGFILAYNGELNCPTEVGNITLVSNVIALRSRGPNSWGAGVGIFSPKMTPYALPQIPSFTAQYNQISIVEDERSNVLQWGIYLWNIYNALVSDNRLNNSTRGLCVNNSFNLTRMPLSFLRAYGNINGGRRVNITGGNSVFRPPVNGTQQKGDFNLDENADLLWHNRSTGQNVLWPMNGPAWGGCSNGVAALADAGWVVSGTADFTGDCNNDIVWTMPGTTNVLLWTMKGLSLIESNWLPELAIGEGIAGTGDFNGDGMADLLITNSTATVIRLMNGTAKIQDVTLTNAPPSSAAQIVGVGELAGTELADILWRDSATGSNTVWVMQGTNVLVATSLSRQADPDWQVEAVADFDGDGIADIVWRHAKSGENKIWLTGSRLGPNHTEVVLPQMADPNWVIAGPK
jgi:hypothetical protein